jgi:hypothetical protein
MSNDYLLPLCAALDLVASKRPPIPLGGVCLAAGFFVVSALMMLGCFAVVTRGVRIVLSADCLGSSAAFLDIGVFPLLVARYTCTVDMKRHISESVPLLTCDVFRSVAISRHAVFNSIRSSDTGRKIKIANACAIACNCCAPRGDTKVLGRFCETMWSLSRCRARKVAGRLKNFVRQPGMTCIRHLRT